MGANTTAADLTAFFVQESGALLFGMVFLFLWRQSRVVYFGLWSAAWAMRLFATFFAYELLSTANAGWLAPYAVFEFGFVIVLIAAARAGFASTMKDWRTVLRLISILPVFVALVWMAGRIGRMEAYQATHAAALGFVYLYNFFALRHNATTGARAFRFSLALLAAAFLAHAAIFLYIEGSPGAPAWLLALTQETYYDFALHSLMAFAAMAMWSESQIDRIRGLAAEVDHMRRESAQNMDLDRLTGLLNQAALERRVGSPAVFEGVVAVCDMDNFKDVNDSYGHLVGDEILRNIGHLLQTSVRKEDEAVRWGGDEFVILFRDQHTEVAGRRMADIEARLRDFRVRGFGALPISFSWGTAEARGRALREALNEADRNMYALKKSRSHAQRSSA